MPENSTWGRLLAFYESRNHWLPWTLWYTSVGSLIGARLEENNVSTAHPIPTYVADASPKRIVKFTCRSVRNKFYSNRRKLARKKANDLLNLNLSSQAGVFISESLTPSKKKLFGDVNKVKKKLKWEHIWIYGRIFIRQGENKPSFSFDREEDLAKFKSQHTSSC